MPSFDAASHALNSGVDVAGLSWSHTLAGGSNRAILVAVTFRETVFASQGTPVATVTVGGAVMTQIGNAANGLGRSELWFRAAPASGAQTIQLLPSADYDGVMCMAAAGLSFTDADQGTPSTVTAMATDGAPTLSVPTAAGDSLVMDLLGVVHGANFATRTAGAGQTTRVDDQQSSGGGVRVSNSSSTEPGTGAPVTMSWTLSASKAWQMIGLELKHTAPPPPPPPPVETAPIGLSPYVRHELFWRRGIRVGDK